MSTISIDWDRNLNPEELDKASKKASQRDTFMKFAATPSDKVTTSATINIA